MDPGTDSADADDIIQRHGRRLFVLAYNLTGDGGQADDLAQECLVRRFLAPDLPPGDREAVVSLTRGLISLWKERLDRPARHGAPRPPGVVSAASARPAGGHAGLWRALSSLDPTSRAILVLRLAGDLEYETIGRILDLTADAVYARLLLARARLRQGEKGLDRPLFETMNLYLDGRLPADRCGDFERRLQSDASLRERVEFHRGLTLELREEAPPLPRDFARRIHDRLDRTRETLALVDQAVQDAGREPAAASPAPVGASRPPSWWSVAAVAALAVVVAATAYWIARRGPAAAPETPASRSPEPGPSASPQTTPDEATIEALRSLGYLAPARDRPAPGPASTPAVMASMPRKTPAVPAPAPSEPAPGPRKSAPAPPPTQPAPGPEVRPWRVVPAGMVPGLERDHKVIRTVPEWVALFEGTGAAAPDVAFDRDMVVLLRHDLHSDPPSILVIALVAQTAEALVIECRREPPPAGAEGTGSPAAGQAIILPISDLPIRVVIR